MLMAGLDGVQNKIDPGGPMDMDLYESEEGKHVKQVPGSLDLALKALEDDHDPVFAGKPGGQLLPPGLDVGDPAADQAGELAGVRRDDHRPRVPAQRVGVVLEGVEPVGVQDERHTGLGEHLGGRALGNGRRGRNLPASGRVHDPGKREDQKHPGCQRRGDHPLVARGARSPRGGFGHDLRERQGRRGAVGAVELGPNLVGIETEPPCVRKQHAADVGLARNEAERVPLHRFEEVGSDLRGV